MSSYTQLFKLSVLGGEQQSSIDLVDGSSVTTSSSQNPATSTMIVVVHGLNGGHEATWTMSSGELWLKDMALMVPHSYFMTFEYGSYVNEVGWGVVSPLGIWTVAVGLLQSLLQVSRECKLNDRRYIFIAQGYGGIVIKQALLIAHHQHTYMQIARSTLGLVSFGTPSSSDLRRSDNQASWRIIFDMIVPFEEGSRNNQNLFSPPQIPTFENCEDWLAICESFQEVSKQYNIINISTRVRTGTSASGKTGPDEPPTTSTSEHWPIRDRTYISLSKFSSADDEDFLRLSKELNKMIKGSEALDFDLLSFRKRLAFMYRESPPSSTLPRSGTFNWVWDDKQFLQWSKIDVNGILHLRGSAGLGKTALCTYLHRELQEKGGATVLSFFCYIKDDYHDHIRYSMISVLRKLLYFEPALYTHFAEEFRIISESSIWTKEDLWGLLRKLLSYPRERPFIFIFDSVDYLGSDHLASGIGGWLLERLVGLQQQTNCPFSLVISSECHIDRFIVSISSKTTFVIDLDTVPEVSHDVETVFQYYLSDLVQRTPAFTGLQEYLSKEFSTLSAHQRTFLSNEIWLGLLGQPQFDLTMNSLSTQIRSLQPDLHYLYEHILSCTTEGIRPWAYKALTWITYSYRPLKLDELRVALSMENGKFNEQYQPLHLINDLYAAFGPLIRIVRDEIHFIHSSFKRFMTNVGTQNSRQWYSLESVKAHVDIFDSCLSYLSQKDVFPSEPEDSQEFEDTIELHTMISFKSTSMGLLLYAAQYWPLHYQQCAHLERAPTSYSSVLNFLEMANLAHVWYRINRILEGQSTDAGEFSPLIVATKMGLPNLVRELVEKIGLGDPEIQKALDLASTNGYTTIVEEILNARFNADQAERSDRQAHVQASSPLSITNALVAATTMGLETMVSVLLRNAEQRKLPREELHLERLLSISARKGHLDIIEILLDEFTNINSVYEDFTPLQHATIGGQSDVVRLLLQRPEIDISIGMLSRNSAMHLAALDGDMVIMKLLLAAADSADAGSYQRGPLHEAARSGHSDVVDLLLTKYPGLINSKDETEMTALHWSVMGNHLPVMKQLLQRGASVWEKDDCGSVPLIYAASYGYTECLDALLESVRDRDSSNMEDIDSEISASLYSAALNGHAKAVRQLLHNGADPTELYGNHDTQQTALHAAAEGGYVDALTVLIDEGEAVVNAKSSSGNTPLHSACEHPKAMRCLIERGANVNAVNNYEKTPLMLAASTGNGDAVKLLLEKGAFGDAYINNPSHVHHYYTALHYAAESGSWDCVEPLMSKVWPFSRSTISSHTPLDIAFSQEHPLLAQKMVEWIINKKYWSSPFEWALKHCVNDEIIDLWLKLRPEDLKATSASGTPSLIMFAARGNPRFVELSLADGVDRNVQDERGRTALDAAYNPVIRALLNPQLETNPQSTLNKRQVLPFCYHEYRNYLYWRMFCRRCDKTIRDGFCYHCYQCRENNFDLCLDCYGVGKRCDDPKEHTMGPIFVYDDIRSIEMFSPWVTTLQPPNSGKSTKDDNSVCED